MIGTCKFTTLRICIGDTGRTLAYIFAANDEEGVLEVIHLDWAGSDATLVDQWRRTTRTCYSIEDERLRIPI